VAVASSGPASSATLTPAVSARRAAGDEADKLPLTPEQEAAYHRTVDRLNTMVTIGDPLSRWAMGTIDYASGQQEGS
jgi:hypothetical protein